MENEASHRHNRKTVSSTGATWEGDQELNAHPAAIISLSDDESGYFEKLGAKTESVLEDFFTKWGTYCASKPWLILFLGEPWKTVKCEVHSKTLHFLHRFLLLCVNGTWY